MTLFPTWQHYNRSTGFRYALLGWTFPEVCTLKITPSYHRPDTTSEGTQSNHSEGTTQSTKFQCSEHPVEGVTDIVGQRLGIESTRKAAGPLIHHKIPEVGRTDAQWLKYQVVFKPVSQEIGRQYVPTGKAGIFGEGKPVVWLL